MIVVPKQRALKMVIKIIMLCKRALSTYRNLYFRLVQQKIRKMAKKTRTFWARKLLNDLLILNYGLPSKFNILGT